MIMRYDSWNAWKVAANKASGAVSYNRSSECYFMVMSAGLFMLKYLYKALNKSPEASQDLRPKKPTTTVIY